LNCKTQKKTKKEKQARTQMTNLLSSLLFYLAGAKKTLAQLEQGRSGNL